ncbi:MAG: delta-60 repeat domain-containing protein [Halobacteriovoraceae bacterium]|nr:delta-60 repeat domain-containing protein [Halobacteriovoraceae bacterium]
MKIMIKFSFFILILTILESCNGQGQFQSDPSAPSPSPADNTVEESNEAILGSISLDSSSITKEENLPLVVGGISNAAQEYCIQINNSTTQDCNWLPLPYPLSINLTDYTDGDIELYSWVRNSDKKISATVKSNKITLDRIPPSSPLSVFTTPLGGNTENPKVSGAIFDDAETIFLYSNSICDIPIGEGSRNNLTASGIEIHIDTADALPGTPLPISIYGIIEDIAGNRSGCEYLIDYVYTKSLEIHSISFTSISESSPSNQETPRLIGLVSNSVTTIELYTTSNCIGTSIGSGTPDDYTQTGIIANISLNPSQAENIYALAKDNFGGSSPCTYLTSYRHDNIAPANPTGIILSPNSPGNSLNFNVKTTGLTDNDIKSVHFYTDASCSNLVGDLDRFKAENIGQQFIVSQDSTNNIYVKVEDYAQNISNCSPSLGSYTHQYTSPIYTVTFTSISPLSPSSNNTPNLIGSISPGATSVQIYSDSSCTTSIGSGSVQDFESTGIAATVGLNPGLDQAVYAKAFDNGSGFSSCTLLTYYQHDSIAPSNLTSAQLIPSNNDNTILPIIKGTLDLDVETIFLYKDPACSSLLASGQASNYTGQGITFNADINSVTNLYIKTQDKSLNTSDCSSTPIASYTHTPLNNLFLSFESISPLSPSSNPSPQISASTSEETDFVSFYTSSNCTGGSIGNGTRSELTSGGIAININLNPGASQPIYARAQDNTSGSMSPCTFMTSYLHDDILPMNPDPSEVSINPSSPNQSLNPYINFSTLSSDTKIIKLYSDDTCSSLLGSSESYQAVQIGIQVQAIYNQTLEIYSQVEDIAGNSSACSSKLIEYTHSPSLGLSISFSSLTPSQTSSNQTPIIRGSGSPEIDTVTFYEDSLCLTGSIGSGSFSDFNSGVGIVLSPTTNPTNPTPIYAMGLDINTLSSTACTAMTTYLHDDTAPNNVTNLAFNPSGPSNLLNPLIKGDLDSDVKKVYLYTDSSCNNLFTSGSGDNFRSPGLQVSVTPGSTLALYSITEDYAGNTSSCLVSPASYTHEIELNLSLSLVSISPEKTGIDPNPNLIGTASNEIDVIEFYTDSACSGTLAASGSRSNFIGPGIEVGVHLNPGSEDLLFAKGIDNDTLEESNCIFLTRYLHDDTPPDQATGVSFSPLSPSDNQYPYIKGSLSSDVVSVKVFSDSNCSNLISQGSAQDFTSIGFRVNALLNNQLDTYTITKDFVGNESSCSSLQASYTHEYSTPIYTISFSNITPLGPSINSTPLIQGAATPSAVNVNFHTEPSCSDTAFFTGSVIDFNGSGVSIQVPLNSTTSIYAQAVDENSGASNCAFMSTYTHDDIIPANIANASTNPVSGNSSTTPIIRGEIGDDVSNVFFYSDSTCSTLITSAQRDLFLSSGVQVQANLNVQLDIYSKTRDGAGNESSCSASPLVSYFAITPPSFSISSLTPGSPNQNLNPNIKGISSEYTEKIQFFNDSSCSNSILSGVDGTDNTKALFESSSGITLNVDPNSENTIYAKAIDSYGNETPCNYITNYIHDNIAPNNIINASSSPASGSDDTTPIILGDIDDDVVYVRLYSDSQCNNQLKQGNASIFKTNGLAINVLPDTIVSVYSKTIDEAGNVSTCSSSPLLSYSNTSSPSISFSAIMPSSPSIDNQPYIKGLSNASVLNVQFYKDFSCQNLISSVDASSFNSVEGAQIELPQNKSTQIYAKGITSTGKSTVCTPMIEYLHDTLGPNQISSIAHVSVYGLVDTSPPISWNITNDSGVGLDFYEVALGSSPGETDIRGWTNVSKSTSTQFSSLDLDIGETYYVNVRATDLLGNISLITSSSGWVVNPFIAQFNIISPLSGIDVTTQFSQITGVCTGDGSVVLSYGSAVNGPIAVNCVNNSFVANITLSGSPGPRQISASQQDQYGNFLSETRDFNYNPTMSIEGGFNGAVYAAAYDNEGRAYVGGAFTTYKGIAQKYLVRLNQSGEVDYSFTSSNLLNGIVHDIEIVPDGSGDIIVVGEFLNVDAVRSNRITRLDKRGRVVTSFDCGLGALGGCFNNIVNDIEFIDSNTFIAGGVFTSYNGQVTGTTVAINANDGSINLSYQASFGTGSVGATNAIEVSKLDGSIFVGGALTSWNGVTASRLVKLNSLGVRDLNFAPAPNQSIQDVLHDGTGVYIVGNFTLVSGLAAKYIARLNATTGALDTSFDTSVGFSNAAYDIEKSKDGHYLVGGQFITYNGISSEKIAYIDNNANLLNSNSYTAAFNNTVREIVFYDTSSSNRHLVGGLFTSYRLMGVNHFTAFDDIGAIDAGFLVYEGIGTGSITTIYQMKDGSGDIYIGGCFNTYQGVTVNGIVRINADGSIDEGFDIGFSDSTLTHKGIANSTSCVYDIEVDPETKDVYLAGSFTKYRNTLVNRVVRLHPDGSIDPDFNIGSGFNGSVFALLLDKENDSIFIGGAFTTYNGSNEKYALSLNILDGSINTNFYTGAGFNGAVHDIKFDFSSDQLLVGGLFTSYNNIINNYIVRLYTDGTYDSSFITGEGFNNAVNDIELANNGSTDIYIAGKFTTYQGITAQRIIKINSSGQIQYDFDTTIAANNEVYDLEVLSDGRLLIAGSFITYGSSDANRICKVNTNGTIDNTFRKGSQFDGIVVDIDILIDGSQRVFAGGSFTQYNGITRDSIARITNSGTLD